MARLAVGVVGAVAGFYLGGPVGALQGFTLAYGLSAGLDPNKKVLGPRLQDLKAPQAAYGAVIPYIEGAPRLAGCFIWSSTKREVANTTTTDGKGGPGVDSTTFTYEIDCGIELAINRAQAIRRIWSNGKLIWSQADDADAETIVASAQTTAWRDIRFYDGNPDQLPDPTYEALVGVGNAPAYRTRTTVVIEGLNLGGSGQLPVLTFEVVTETGGEYVVDNFATLPFSMPPFEGETAPFLAGIAAMQPTGYTFLYGDNYDSLNGGHTSCKVFEVSSTGTISLVRNIDYGGKQGNTLQGNSDVSCLVALEYDPAFVPAISYFTVWKAYGSSVAFSFDQEPAGTADTWRFSMRGNRVAIASSTVGGLKVVRIYNALTGTLIVQSPAMAAPMQFCAIGDGVVFALDSNDGAEHGDNVYEIDLVTGALIRTIPTPFQATQSSITTDEDGNLYLFSLGTIPDPDPVYKWDGAAWTRVIANEPRLYSTPNERHAYYASRNVFGLQRFDSSGVAPLREQFFLAVRNVSIVEPTLAAVVRRLCLRTRQLEDADLDLTELESDIVRSMGITTVSATRTTIETLMAAYLFEWSEGATLRAVKRGGSSVATIPYEDLGASPDGSAEPLAKRRINDVEQVARVSVKYANVLNDSQDGLEQADRLVTASTAEQVVEVPLGFTPTEAKRLADANTMDAAVSLVQIGPAALSRKYAHLEVGDVFTVTDQDGSTYRVRGVKLTLGGGTSSFDVVLDDASAIASVAATDDSYDSSTLVKLLSDTELEELDIPILRDADNGLGPYVAISAGDRWSSARIDKSNDGVSFATVGSMTAKTYIGAALTTLGNFTGGNVFDDASSVTVDMNGGVLTSCTKADALAGTAPAYLIGSEIVYACTATFVSAGVYKLTTFLRGLRGTEWAIAGHVAAERVVLLQVEGLRKIADLTTDYGVPRYYRAVTGGKSVADAEIDTFTDTGVAMMPFAPADLVIDWTIPAAPVLSWHRRSRFTSSLFGLAPPLGEVSEAYDVELTDGSNLVESVTVTTPSYTPGSTPSAGWVVTVWQKSATVGRGYPASLEF